MTRRKGKTTATGNQRFKKSVYLDIVTWSDSMKNSFIGFNPDTMTPDGYAAKKGLSDGEKVKLQRQYKNYQAKKAITGLSAGAL